MVVASRAPLAALGAARNVLHVLDGFPVKLIIERREMVHGALPLVVNILVAFAAALRIHEEVGWDDAAHIGLGRRGPEGRLGSAAFLFHRNGDQRRVADAAVGIREIALVEPGGYGDDQNEREPRRHGAKSHGAAAPQIGQERGSAQHRQSDMQPQRPAVGGGCAEAYQPQAERQGPGKASGGHPGFPSIKPQQAGRGAQAQHQM